MKTAQLETTKSNHSSFQFTPEINDDDSSSALDDEPGGLSCALYEVQFTQQSAIRNDLAKKPFFRYLFSRLLNSPIETTPLDIAHEEALKINKLTDFVLNNTTSNIYSAQQVSDKISLSSEFELKSASEITDSENLLKYCPETIELIESAQIDKAISESKDRKTIRRSKTLSRSIQRAIHKRVNELVDSAIKTNNYDLLTDLIINNELRNIGYFSAVAQFPEYVITKPAVQEKLLRTLNYCLMFEYPNDIEEQVRIVRENKLLPNSVINKSKYDTEQARAKYGPVYNSHHNPGFVAQPSAVS